MTRCTYKQFRRMFLSCSYKLHFIALEHPSRKKARIEIKLDRMSPHGFSERCYEIFIVRS